MYGEAFDIPAPDELVFISSFEGGEVFRGGCCFRRGRGRIFYFSPGDQDYPVYHHPDVQRVIANAVRWAAARVTALRAVVAGAGALGPFWAREVPRERGTELVGWVDLDPARAVEEAAAELGVTVPR